MVLPNVSGVLAFMYTDRMTVKRYQPATGPDGEAAEFLGGVPELTDIPCRLSLGAKDSPLMTEDGNPTDVQPTLICRPEIQLRSGDFIIVQRLTDATSGIWRDIYSGNIGRPNLYASSLQVMFQDRGKS